MASNSTEYASDYIWSASYQKSIISGNLNSSLMNQFLFGGYLGFWVYTVIIYRSKAQGRRHRMIICILTLLFVITLGQVGIQWYMTYAAFGDVGWNRSVLYDDARIGSHTGAMRTIFSNSLVQAGQAFADGLMIWRCWQISYERRDLRIMVACFYCVQVGLVIACISEIVLAVGNSYDLSLGVSYELSLGISFLVTAITSITATLVIGTQIHRSTGHSVRARRRYSHITEILAQSSALYSLSLFCQAIQTLYQYKNQDSSASELINGGNYLATIMTFTTAFAPTLMVARLSVAKDRATESSTTHTMSAPQDEALSDFVAQPLEGDGTSLQNENRDDNLGTFSSGEV